MNSHTDRENEMTTDELLQIITAKSQAYGLRVVCPTCKVGRGKWCRDSSGKVVLHDARARLAA